MYVPTRSYDAQCCGNYFTLSISILGKCSNYYISIFLDCKCYIIIQINIWLKHVLLLEFYLEKKSVQNEEELEKRNGWKLCNAILRNILLCSSKILSLWWYRYLLLRAIFVQSPISQTPPTFRLSPIINNCRCRTLIRASPVSVNFAKSYMQYIFFLSGR